jgi:hypothetical protein
LILNDGTNLDCAGGYGSWRIKLSNYLLRPNLAGYASLGGEHVGSLSNRNVGISSRRDLKRQLSTDHILPALRQAAVAFDRIRVQDPQNDLQLKIVHQLPGGSEFLAYVDAIGELDGLRCSLRKPFQQVNTLDMRRVAEIIRDA